MTAREGTNLSLEAAVMARAVGLPGQPLMASMASLAEKSCSMGRVR